MEKPNVDLSIRKERLMMFPIHKFLSAEHEYGDISDDIAEMLDARIEQEKEQVTKKLEDIEEIEEKNAKKLVPPLLRRSVAFKMDEDDFQ